MGFARTVVAVMFLCVLGFYLSSVGELTDEAKWGSVALMGILAFGWINLGTAPRKPVAAPQPHSETRVEPQTEAEVERLKKTMEFLNLLRLNRLMGQHFESVN